MPEPGAGVTALVLAAGHGKRFSSGSTAFPRPHKLLAQLRLKNLQAPVLAHTLQALAGVVEQTLVLLREDDLALRTWAARRPRAPGVQWRVLSSAGIGDSLAQGARLAEPERGFLVVLGDMPLVRPATLHELVAHIEPERLVLPTFQAQRGHPRGIGSSFRNVLCQCSGEKGAAELFQCADATISELSVDDPGVLHDIDYPADLLVAERR